MLHRLKLRTQKTGMPPGTLMHVGAVQTEETTLSLLDYSEHQIHETVIATAEACRPYQHSPSVTWINVDGLHQVDVLQQVGQVFNLHHLVLEDILHTDQRPKLEDYGHYLYLVLKMLHYDDKTGQVAAEQISLILLPTVVISFQEKGGDIFDPVRDRIRENRGLLRRAGADYLVYALLDAVVDNYFIILEKLGENIELLEEELVDTAGPNTLQVIYNLKRELIYLHKAVWPLREVISGLTRGDTPFFQPATVVYLRDVYDHTIQVLDLVETYRDLVAGMLDIYLSSMSNKMNAIMKVLTVIATIFIPLTFITSLYGMNFKFMPELEWPWGYPAVWTIMLVISAALLIYFRIKRWL